jgi:hypothetical protein
MDFVDYFSESRRMAAQFREVYEAFVSVGFSEEQAMELLKSFLALPVGPRG